MDGTILSIYELHRQARLYVADSPIRYLHRTCLLLSLVKFNHKNLFQYVQKRQDREKKVPTLRWDLERQIHEEKLDTTSSVATAPSLLAQEP